MNFLDFFALLYDLNLTFNISLKMRLLIPIGFYVSKIVLKNFLRTEMYAFWPT